LVEVRLRTSDSEPGEPLARGIGSTKKLAEQDAARLALERLTSRTIGLRDEEASEEVEELEAE
jgi:dsRNA-specific ribonuclease